MHTFMLRLYYDIFLFVPALVNGGRKLKSQPEKNEYW